MFLIISNNCSLMMCHNWFNFRNSITNKFGSPGNSNISMSGTGMIGQTQVPGIVSSGSGLNTSNAFNSYIDDSIGSFMGSLTPTRIDSSPAHGQRYT